MSRINEDAENAGHEVKEGAKSVFNKLKKPF
jgi:hypothetical protein